MVGWFSRTVVAMTLRMPRWFVRWVSRRYVAGATLDDAVTIMKRLSSEGACFTIDVLGEEISTMDEAQYFFDEYVRAIDAIQQHGLDANLSIKPTAFGLLIDEEAGMENLALTQTTESVKGFTSNLMTLHSRNIKTSLMQQMLALTKCLAQEHMLLLRATIIP